MKSSCVCIGSLTKELPNNEPQNLANLSSKAQAQMDDVRLPYQRAYGVRLQHGLKEKNRNPF